MLQARAMRALVLVAVATLAGKASAQVGMNPYSATATPEQRQKMFDDMYAQTVKTVKDVLGLSDDEWKVLEPKLITLAKAKQEINSAVAVERFLNQPNYKLPTEALPDAEKTELQKKAEALRKVLADKEAKADDIKAAMAAYREARDKAKKDLEKAKKDVRDVLTARQEATLVLCGQLD